jgi:large subunit ribosomal protein L35
MPKLKTYKAAAKRFKITGRGKLRRRKQSYGHKRYGKSKRARYQFRKDASVSKADRKRVMRLLGGKK